MKQKKYDVVVVGGGPAGAIAGKFAALNGAETLIVEDKRQFGSPIYDPMSVIFGRAEIEEVTGEKIEPTAVYARPDGLIYVSPSGNEGKRQLLPDAVFVNRHIFEKSLAIGAVRAGAEVVLHTKAVDLVKQSRAVTGVVVKNSSGLTTIPCSVVVSADGSYQQMGRLAGIELPGRSILMAVGCEMAGVKVKGGPHRNIEIHLDDSSEGLYRYIVPYASDRFSIDCTANTPNIDHRKSLRQRLDEMIRHLEETGKYDFSRASAVNLMSGGMISLTEGPIAPKLAADGIILAGFAAGSPFFSTKWGGFNTMHGSCWSGRLAGILAAAAAKKGDFSGESLDKEYHRVITESYNMGGPRMWEALQVWGRLFTLSRAEQDQAVAEIGGEMAALHFYSKGCLAPPLPSCLEPVKNWLKERGK